MKRRVIRMVLTGAVVVAAVVLLWPRGEREPEYQGKKLSEWLALDMKENWDTAEAVRAMGTNALPYLVRWLDCKRPGWQSKMMDAGRNYIPKLWNRVFGINDPKVVRMQNAVWAFDRLGAQAAPAIPDLIRLMKEGSEDLAWTASSILGGMGENAVPVLLEVLTNRQADLRFRTAALGTAIQHPPTNGALLVPVLMPYLTNQDAECRGLAATMLGDLQATPSNAVPGLVGLLRDQDRNTRYRAINALGRFGTDARGACASLLPVLKDSDGSIRQAAEIALRAIAPEVLENAGAGSGRN